MIDHHAKQPFRSDGWDRWKAQLEAAAERPNLVAKMSRLDTAAGPGWTVQEVAPAVDVALEAFGGCAADVRERLAGLPVGLDLS